MDDSESVDKKNNVARTPIAPISSGRNSQCSRGSFSSVSWRSILDFFGSPNANADDAPPKYSTDSESSIKTVTDDLHSISSTSCAPPIVLEDSNEQVKKLEFCITSCRRIPLPTYRMDDYVKESTLAESFDERKVLRTRLNICTKKSLSKRVLMKIIKDVQIVDINREILLMKRCQGSPNIVEFYDGFFIPTGKLNKQDGIVVMEYCECKDLFNRISTYGACNEVEVRTILVQLFHGIAHIHHNHVVHRDLKPENIVFAFSDDRPVLKICDFGSAAHLTPGEFLTTCSGTPLYSAPEMFGTQIRYNEKVDIWSAGIVAYILLCGRTPCSNLAFNAIYRWHKRHMSRISLEQPSWNLVSAEAKQFVSFLLQPNVDSRPGIDDVLAHPYLHEDEAREAGCSNIDYNEIIGMACVNMWRKTTRHRQFVICNVGRRTPSETPRRDSLPRERMYNAWDSVRTVTATDWESALTSTPSVNSTAEDPDE